jgi:hypothetical protein
MQASQVGWYKLVEMFIVVRKGNGENWPLQADFESWHSPRPAYVPTDTFRHNDFPWLKVFFKTFLLRSPAGFEEKNGQ